MQEIGPSDLSVTSFFTSQNTKGESPRREKEFLVMLFNKSNLFPVTEQKQRDEKQTTTTRDDDSFKFYHYPGCAG